MKLIHSIYLVPLVLAAACQRTELVAPTRECGPIELKAGIVESGDAETKAGVEDHHVKHLALTTGTRLNLRVIGDWSGHVPATVAQPTTATVGAPFNVEVEEVTRQHNALSCSPVLYWDDYGTADPDNTTGRTNGLTIYGVAIDGKTSAPYVSDWTALEWTLPTNQTTSGNTPADQDLLISNNVQPGTGDGTYKFDSRASGKLLEFTHALSKITVNLHAGNGFTDGEFASDPSVTLYGNWAYTSGNVNVTTGAWDSQDDGEEITMFQKASDGSNVTKEALVIPGSAFASDATDILRINADGNIYYVTAEMIRAKIVELNLKTGDDYLTLAGYNYIINVTVNKTHIVVTATISDWSPVEAANVSPVINVTASYGDTDDPLGDGSFSFYRSLSLNDGYSEGSAVNGYYPEESVLVKSGSDLSMTPQLYWPTHNTHYQFRAVWPRTVTTDVTTSPKVEDEDYGEATNFQVIRVENVAYSANSFPSDLQIARPEIDPSLQCTNNEPGHTHTYLYDGGICATRGNINLNFRYMMCQVEVNLSTTPVTSLNDHVNLTGAVVEIINVHNTGDVKLGDRSVVPTGSTGTYTLDTVAGEGNENKRLSAIVPQTLTYTGHLASENAKFKITITNSDSTKDVYYADLAPIMTPEGTYVNPVYVATHVTSPSEKWYWESGKHYIYNLTLSKTMVKVSASLATWTTVTANENVWF